MRWVDVPAFSPAGLPTFLAKARECHALLHVLNCFDPEAPDPVAAMEEVAGEFLLADLSSIDKKLRLLGDRRDPDLRVALQKFQACLEDNRPLRELPWTKAEEQLAAPFQFLTLKPLLYAPNLDDRRLAAHPSVAAVRAPRGVAGVAPVLPVCATLEELLAACDTVEAAQVAAEYGLAASAIPPLVRAGAAALGYHTFYTAGAPETRAWWLPPHSTALQAAAQIHSDIAQRLAKVLVIPFETFRGLGSLAAAERAYEAHGKEYPVRDGDVLHFRHR